MVFKTEPENVGLEFRPNHKGHDYLFTTAIYLHVTEGELRDAVHAHPLAD